MFKQKNLNYKLEGGRTKKSFFCQHLSREYWPPGHENLATYGYGLLLGCRSALDEGPVQTLFVDDVRKQNWPKTGKFFTVCPDPRSQSI